jgi:hypothetical protein
MIASPQPKSPTTSGSRSASQRISSSNGTTGQLCRASR